MTTLKQVIATGANAHGFAFCDSRGAGELWRWSHKVLDLIGIEEPNLTLIKVERLPGISPVTTVVRQGSSSQSLTWTIDAYPGACSSRLQQISTLTPAQCHAALILLGGVNDAVQFYDQGNASYAPVYTMLNHWNAIKWLVANRGCTVGVMNDCWRGSNLFEPGVSLCHYSNAIELAVQREGVDLINSKALFNGHWNQTGQAGQGNWFPFPDDRVHFGGEPNLLLARLCMPALGYPIV